MKRRCAKVLPEEALVEGSEDRVVIVAKLPIEFEIDTRGTIS